MLFDVVSLNAFVSQIPTTFIWIPFIVIFLITALYTLIFIYHWRKFSIAQEKRTKLVISVYLVGTVILLFFMIASALWYGS